MNARLSLSEAQIILNMEEINMKILVINAGSSSLKYQLIDMDNESVMAKGSVTRIGLPESVFEQKIGDVKYKYVKDMLIKDGQLVPYEGEFQTSYSSEPAEEYSSCLQEYPYLLRSRLHKPFPR